MSLFMHLFVAIGQTLDNILVINLLGLFNIDKYIYLIDDMYLCSFIDCNIKEYAHPKIIFLDSKNQKGYHVFRNESFKRKGREITKGEELYEYPIGATGLVRLSGHSFYLLLRSGALRSPEAGQHRERCAL